MQTPEIRPDRNAEMYENRSPKTGLVVVEGTEFLQRVRLTINGAVAWTGTPLEASCADAGIAAPGEYLATVTAYNDVGESASSNELVFTYVTGAPINAPTMLRFQP